MKTTKINTRKTATAALLLAAVMTLSLCSQRDGDADRKGSKTAIRKTNPKPPEMDIHTAALLGDLKTIQQHIKAGSDLNATEPSGGSTPLITAIVFGRTEVARALIEAGAGLNITNKDGSTPLYCAAFFCRTEIVGALLEKGADKSIVNIYGLTALESVAGPFSEVKEIYDIFSKELGPMGFRLDYEQVELARPRIAEMLRQAG